MVEDTIHEKKFVIDLDKNPDTKFDRFAFCFRLYRNRVEIVIENHLLAGGSAIILALIGVSRYIGWW